MKCYICGRDIEREEPYYSIGGNTYVCSNDECYEEAFWDLSAARFMGDTKHEYAVIDGYLYHIGTFNLNDGHYCVKFNDCFLKEGSSLWYIGEIPKPKQYIFKQNAYFIQKGECGNYD